jgi:ubiquinone/menaquinone biosynthesis C-methylase UbiE
MRLFRSLLRIVYSLLYHQFAWAYDLVAWTVSLGRWNDWVKTAIPYLEGQVLELGFGRGHLQQIMDVHNLHPIGLDKSRFMARQAHHCLKKGSFMPRLLVGCAQNIPIPANTVNSVVSTFPAEYIFDPQTLAEVYRVLTPGGKFVIVPTAWFTGKNIPERLAAILYRLTGQEAGIDATLKAFHALIPINRFTVRHEIVDQEGSRVLVIIATRV